MIKEAHTLIRSGLEEVLADLRGESVGLRSTVVEVGVDVRAIRAKLGLTQPKMAQFLGTSKSGYQKWEQGSRHPRGAALTLLRIADAEPEAVARVIAGDQGAVPKTDGAAEQRTAR